MCVLSACGLPVRAARRQGTHRQIARRQEASPKDAAEMFRIISTPSLSACGTHRQAKRGVTLRLTSFSQGKVVTKLAKSTTLFANEYSYLSWIERISFRGFYRYKAALDKISQRSVQRYHAGLRACLNNKINLMNLTFTY